MLTNQERQQALEGFMTVENAIEIVLDLARENVIDTMGDPDLEDEQKVQTTALDVIEDFFTNKVFG